MRCLGKAAYYFLMMPWAIFCTLTAIFDVVAVGFFFYDLFNTLVSSFLSINFYSTEVFSNQFNIQIVSLCSNHATLEHGRICAPFTDARYNINLFITRNRCKHSSDAGCYFATRRMSWLHILVLEHFKYSNRAVALQANHIRWQR